MLDEDLLRDYCEGFFGYGNPMGKYWFIGPEEAGGRCEEEVRERLELWKQHPEPREIVDGFEFNAKRKCSKQPFHKPQTTWDRLIHVQVAAEGRDATDVEIAAYKETEWARKSARNCLLELLPLPCPSTRPKKWPHDRWTKKDSVFQSRECYEEKFFEPRRAALKRLIGKPKVVIFYSTGKRWLPHWSTIAGLDWQSVKPTQFGTNGRYKAFFRCRGGTLYVLMHHPGYRCPNHYFDQVGKEIKARLPRCSGT